MKRKFLAWLLTIAMVFNMALPYAAFADDFAIDADTSYSADEFGATNNDDDATDVEGEPTVGEPSTDDELAVGEPSDEEPAVDPVDGNENNAESDGKEGEPAGEPQGDEPVVEPNVGTFATPQGGVAAVADVVAEPAYTLTITADTEDGKATVGATKFFCNGVDDGNGANYNGLIELDKAYGVTRTTSSGKIQFRVNQDTMSGVLGVKVTIDGQSVTKMNTTSLDEISTTFTPLATEGVFSYVSVKEGTGSIAETKPLSEKIYLQFENANSQMTNLMTDKNITITFIFEETPRYTLTATAGENGSVYGTKLVANTADGSIWRVYAAGNSGYYPATCTLGESTLPTGERTTGTYDGNACEYFDITINQSGTATVNFAEAFYYNITSNMVIQDAESSTAGPYLAMTNISNSVIEGAADQTIAVTNLAKMTGYGLDYVEIDGVKLYADDFGTALAEVDTSAATNLNGRKVKVGMLDGVPTVQLVANTGSGITTGIDVVFSFKEIMYTLSPKESYINGEVLQIKSLLRYSTSDNLNGKTKCGIWVKPKEGYVPNSYILFKANGNIGGNISECEYITWSDGTRTVENAMYFEVILDLDAELSLDFKQLGYKYKVTSNVEWADSRDSTELPYLGHNNVKYYEIQVTQNQVFSISNYDKIADTWELNYVEVDGLKIPYEEFAKYSLATTIDTTACPNLNGRQVQVALENNGKLVFQFVRKTGSEITTDININFVFTNKKGGTKADLTVNAGEGGTFLAQTFKSIGENGYSRYGIYAKPNAGYQLTGYTNGDKTTPLTLTSENYITYGGQDVVYFELEIAKDSEITLNFAEATLDFQLYAYAPVTETAANWYFGQLNADNTALDKEFADNTTKKTLFNGVGAKFWFKINVNGYVSQGTAGADSIKIYRGAEAAADKLLFDSATASGSSTAVVGDLKGGQPGAGYVYIPNCPAVDKITVVAVYAGHAFTKTFDVNFDAPFDITIPSDANLHLKATYIYGGTVTMAEPDPVAVVKNSDGTTTYRFADQGTQSCTFSVGGADYVSYAGSMYVTSGGKMTVTKAMLQPTGKTATTLDRDVQSHGGYNVANMYMNVNAAGHLKMKQGQQFQLSVLRDWWLSNLTWSLTMSKKIVQPDYTYTVLDMDGKVSDDVISIDKNGLITTKGTGDAIVLVSYNSTNLTYPSKELESEELVGFWGACWPENTGVFVVSVDAGETGIKTGATITQPVQDAVTESTTRAIDSEYDVIYFLGDKTKDKGEYTFTPETAGVTVSVANSKITDWDKAGTMTFDGFTELTANTDGSYTVPLVEGKNIIKVAKDGKAEYQVITAKAVQVTVNGMPLDDSGVVPGDKVSIQFSQLYNPQNRNENINSDAGILYRNVSGYPGKTVGVGCGPYGYYKFAAATNKMLIQYFAYATRETSSGYNNPVIAENSKEPLMVPEDYTGEYFSLTDGMFNIVGFGDGIEVQRTVAGFVGDTAGGDTGDDGEEDEGGVKLSNAIFRWLGDLPDIKIPVVNVEKIEVTTQPSKTTYKLNEEFSTDGMVVKVTYTNGASREITDYTCSKLDSATTGEKTVTISYTAGGVTKTTEVTVNVTDLTVTGIEVTTAPTKTVYMIGDTFNPAGMEVTATYSNGSTKVLESGEYTCDTTTPFDNSKAKVNVEVKAAGLTTTVEVTVNMVVKLELDSSVDQPSSEYTVGDTVGKYYVKKTSSTGATSSVLSNMATAFASSPRSRVLTAYDDKYVITTPKTVSMSFQKPNLGIAGLEPLVIPITVKDETGNSANAITVNMTCVVDGQYADGKDGKAVYNLPISVYDLDNDGKITMQDAFVALHHFQYNDGACGYDEQEAGTVMSFWGISKPNSAKYELNGTIVTKAKSQNIVADDNIVAYISDNSNSVVASFAEASATANAGERTAFTVQGKSGETAVIPNGATVTVYDSTGKVVEDLATSVYKDGGFAIRFPSAGTYTIVVGGECTYTSGGSTVKAIVWPARCTVTVSGSTSGGTTTTPEEKTIKVYVTYSEDGEFVTAESSLLYKLPLSVYDYDGDGKYTMADAFAILHKEYYPGGADGYIGSAEDNWISMFWGNKSANLSYTQNYKWVFGVNQVIKSGDKLDIFFYQDETAWSDLLTWFAKDSYSGKTGSEITFTVNGMSPFASSDSNTQATAVPEGATVTIYDEKGDEIATTTTDAKGQFKLSFPDPGLYTIEVGGTCSYSIGGQYGTASYSDAPVVPSRCTVSISGTSTGGGIGGATTSETKYTATEVIDLIDAIGTVTKDSKSAIEKARAAYDSLTAAQQKKVTNYDKLTAAEAKYTELTGEKIEVATGSLPFADVKAGTWYYDAIKTMYDKGLMNGESATQFMPNNKLSRAMLVTILYRLAEQPEVTATANFTDVAADQWYTKAVAWASANKIVSGVGDGKFAPNDSITRQELAAMLYRYASATGLNTTATANLNSFSDSNSVATWAETAMQWAVGTGLIKGDESGALNPTGSATRAEVATVIVRLLEMNAK